MAKFSLDSVLQNSLNKPPIIVLHSDAGVGKTTFASQAPNAIFVTCEDGLGVLPVAHFPNPDTAEDVNEQLQLLKGEHNYQWLVVDSLTALEKKIWRDLCTADGVESIEAVSGGYGKGFTKTLEWIDKFIRDVRYLRDVRQMGVILIAHTKINTINPPDKSSYDQYVLNLNAKLTDYVVSQADIVAYCELELRVRTEEKGGFGREQGTAIETGNRLLHCYSSKKYTSKNRYGIQTPLPLNFQALIDAIMANAPQQ